MPLTVCLVDPGRVDVGWPQAVAVPVTARNPQRPQQQTLDGLLTTDSSAPPRELSLLLSPLCARGIIGVAVKGKVFFQDVVTPLRDAYNARTYSVGVTGASPHCSGWVSHHERIT